jgi:hypothetical protein
MVSLLIMLPFCSLVLAFEERLNKMSIMELLGEQEENSRVNSELSQKIDKSEDNWGGGPMIRTRWINQRRFS